MSASRGKQSALPPMSDVAADLRDGADLGDLAAAFGVTAEQLRHRLNKGGWASSGRPVTATERHEPLPTFVRGDVSWMDDALCAETDLSLFFPKAGAVPFAAMKVCSRCVVKRTCLDYALDNDIDDGLWGGVTRKERRKLKKERVA